MIRQWQRVVFCLLFFFFAVNAKADWNLEIGIENFQWQEFDSGSRLLKESGQRFRGGAEWRRELNPTLMLDVRGSVYFGRVDYDGQAGPPGGPYSPFTTDTNYQGITGETTVSHLIAGSNVLRVFGGGGIDSWRRDVKGHSGVSGAVEDWTTFYAIAGLAAVGNGPNHIQARMGVKFPFYTVEDVQYDVSLNPKGRPSLFARASMDFAQGGRKVWGVGLYYDTYRFDESSRERVGSLLIWQPESRQDTFGIFATIYLQ